MSKVSIKLTSTNGSNYSATKLGQLLSARLGATMYGAQWNDNSIDVQAEVDGVSRAFNPILDPYVDTPNVFEVGIKVVDLLAPYSRGK